MTTFILSSLPWTVTSRLLSETATPSWSTSGFKTYLFEVTIATPGHTTHYAYYAPPHYVSQHRVSLMDEDHRFILASFFEDIINGDMSWADFLTTTGHAGDPRAIDFYTIAKMVSFRAQMNFHLTVQQFQKLFDELVEMPDFPVIQTSAFRDIPKED